jgi:Translation elongation factors (GTPases)
VTLYDGSFHEVDSSDVAFRMAAFMAMRDGIGKAKSVMLEPIMEVEITTPNQFLGDFLNKIRFLIHTMSKLASPWLSLGLRFGNPHLQGWNQGLV